MSREADVMRGQDMRAQGGRGVPRGWRTGLVPVAMSILALGLLATLVVFPLGSGGDGGGYGSVAREVGAGASTYDTLWPYHMALMLTGVGLAVATILFILMKKRLKGAWYKAHWVTGIAAFAVLLAGFSIAFRMVAATQGLHHFEVPHSRVGIITLTVTVAGLVIGLVFLTVRSAKKRVRSPHIWIGWACIGLMVLTVLLGLLRILYTYPGYWK